MSTEVGVELADVELTSVTPVSHSSATLTEVSESGLGDSMKSQIQISFNDDSAIPIKNDALERSETIDTDSQNTQDVNVKTKDKAKENKEKVNVLQLFRYSSGKERFAIIIGLVFAMGHGLVLQIPYLFMSQIITQFSIVIQYNCTEPNATAVECDDVMTLNEASQWIMLRLAICMIFICGSVFFQFFIFTVVADRITRRVRFQAFYNIIRQHTGYFDVHSGGELNTRLTQDIIKFEVGIGGKFSLTVSYLTCFLSGLIICLVEGWMLTLFMCVLLPVAGIVSGITTRFIKIYTEKEMAAHARAGAVAEEAFTNIRVVTAFSGQAKEVEKYEKVLKDAQKISMRSAVVSAIGQGVPWLLTFTITALTAYFSSRMIREGKIESGFVMLLLGCMMQGLRGLGYAAILLETISDSQGAAFGIYRIIEAKTEIDSFNTEGDKLENLEGRVRFEDIHFEYPARSDVPVLRGLTLEIRPGQSAALVGPSGCGKSTTIQLLQRCYQPRHGKVFLDNRDIRDLNISWLRQQMGVVSQEPVLFATSIEENIRFGKPEANLDEIIQAAKEADAHTFINKLPDKYETVLNEQGTQLSRGEKQRISLARALVRNPKILLLDECTSALDNESEAAVQAALDKASKGRTTIVIAHRLSTVRDSDVLFVVNNGVIEECGSHGELLGRNGLYAKLVSTQIMEDSNKETSDFSTSDEEDDGDDVRCDLTEINHDLQKTNFERHTKSSTDKYRASAISSASGCSTAVSEVEKAEDISEERYALMKVFALNCREFPLLILGVFGGLLLGCTYPVFSILFSNVIEAILSDQVNMAVVSDMSAGMIGLGIVCCVVAFLSILVLKIFGEKLTLILRKLAFSSMLHQEIAWFDASENQAGSLTSKLADESSRIKLATGATLLYFVAAFSNVGCSIAIAIIFSWQLGLALLPVMPVAILAGIVQGYMNSTFEKNSHACTATSGKIASEAIDKIRTLASLTKEKYYLEKYMANFDSIKREAKKSGVIIGASWVFLYICGLAIEIITFGYGLQLVDQGKMEFKIIFRMLLVALIMCTEVGRANSNVPELTSSNTAAQSLLKLVKRVSKIDSRKDEGQKPETVTGEVSLTRVIFRYPSRNQKTAVLKRVQLTAAPGQTIAIVGPSGGGKSTVMQLIQRFYDVFSGVVKVDGVDIKDLNVEWLRSQMGVVLQEPILFAVSLAENIAYGDNKRNVPMEEIIEAAKAANIHSFISSLPQGYNTNIGNKGAQLSGGQKQRVSIARALLRNPKILLLDDATSALDSHSESIVEEALSRAREGRTCIAVAHRLSSVVRADVILYMYNGRVLERGTHSELMEMRSHYYSLFQANLGNKTS